MNQKDWLEYFELTNGRKPTAQEFAAAKASGEFTIEKVAGNLKPSPAQPSPAQPSPAQPSPA